MFDIAKDMLDLSLKAFVMNVELAKKIANMDDEVDKLYGETIQTFFKTAGEHKQEFMQITQLSFIARFIERIGD